MKEGPDRELTIFTEATGLPVEQRDVFLTDQCGSDEGLLRRVKALLAAHGKAGDFLESPIGPAQEKDRAATIGEKTGDRIGRYKLLQQIGEGGCGVVFMAEQEEPVRRKVAFKIVKPGMDTKNVIARFEAERQALALMDHPSIAKVFDAGATEAGRPYFVMELVHGIKITEYCDQNSLSTTARLELFNQVCHAVQHAHQKGLIHRDIKPSNILVTRAGDGAALPVVIDFGIAKATTNQQLTDKTLFTAFEMLIGTPAYMSPEQATLRNVDVDTRTDIYSLGVLLYELLTGSTPFESRKLLKAGLDEIRRVICEEEPLWPSTRLSRMTSHDLAAIAQNRKSDPPKLIRAVNGDLDWITMKALEKDRSRRYETANGLAIDVRRFLANEAVSARPPSKLYRFQKTIHRNKLLFLSIGALTTILVASLIVVSTSLAREREARKEADRDKRKAQQSTKFLEDMLGGVGPSIALGKDTAILREMLDRIVDRIGTELGDQPEVEAELRNFIGRLFQDIGDYPQAEKMHRAALTIYRRLHGSSRETADSLHYLGEPLRYLKLAEAEIVCMEALAMRRRIFGTEHAETASTLGSLALVCMQLGKAEDAEAYCREALRIRQRLLGSEHLETADSMRTLAILLGNQGKWEESERMMRDVLATRRKLLGMEHPIVAGSLADLAWAIGGRSHTEEAISLEREALAMRLQLLPARHPDVAKNLYLLGDRMRARGNPGEAQAILTAALSLQRDLLGEGDPASLDTLRSIGWALEAEGKLAEAEASHRKAFALWQKRGENETPQGVGQLESLVGILCAQRKFAEAEQVLNEALTDGFLKQAASVNLLGIRAELRGRSGRFAEAAADAAVALQLQPHYDERYSMLALLLAKARNHSAYDELCGKIFAQFPNPSNLYQADKLAKASLLMPAATADLNAATRFADFALREGTKEKENVIPFFQFCKGLAEYRSGRFDEAIEWSQRAIESPLILARGPAYALSGLAYLRLGKSNDARTMLLKAESYAPSVMPTEIANDPANAWQGWAYTRILLEESQSITEGIRAK